jgi:Ca2+-binding EF-hand superfamily protein
MKWIVVSGQWSVMMLAGLLFVPASSPADETKKAADDVQDFVFLAEARPILVRLHVRVDGKPLQAVSDDFLKHLFSYLDINKDGVLSKEEVERVPTLDRILSGGLGNVGRGGGGGRPGRAAPPPGPSMEDLDTDKDGKVTFAELAAYYRKSGYVPFQVQVSSTQANPLGALAYLGGPKPEPPVKAVSEAIFKLLDANGDGKLTKEELAAAPAALLKLDEDDDEIVTPQELVPNAPGQNNPLAGFGAMGRPARANPSAGNDILVPLPSPGTVHEELVARLQKRYGPKAEKLTRKQLGLDEATFARLDINKDGVLDSTELAGFVKQTPDLELIVRLGKIKGTEARVEIVSEKGKPPFGGKAMMKSGLVHLDLGVTQADLRTGDEERADRFNGIIRQQVAGQFRQADTNGDGFIDETEAKNSRFFRGVFKAMDRDGDGKISEKEFTAYLDKMRDLQARASAGCVTLVLADQSRGLFELLDTDRDGRLSIYEMRQAPKLLARLDRDGKGHLTRDDIPRNYQLTLRRGSAGGDPLGGAGAIFNRLYGGSSYKNEPSRPAAGPMWFQKMDRNRDGFVSRREFLFSDELFRKIDLDGDGLISLAEAEKADVLFRKGEKDR